MLHKTAQQGHASNARMRVDESSQCWSHDEGPETSKVSVQRRRSLCNRHAKTAKSGKATKLCSGTWSPQLLLARCVHETCLLAEPPSALGLQRLKIGKRKTSRSSEQVMIENIARKRRFATARSIASGSKSAMSALITSVSEEYRATR